jgi:hypothetical protein
MCQTFTHGSEPEDMAMDRWAAIDTLLIKVGVGDVVGIEQ